MQALRADNQRQVEDAIKGLSLAISQLDERLNRLTDAYIDRLIERDVFEQRKAALLFERLHKTEALSQWESGKRNAADELLEILERADAAYSAYKVGIPAEKREVVDSLTSNRVLNGKSLEVSLKSPFHLIANRSKLLDGSPRRDIHRTWGRLIPRMINLLEAERQSQAKIAA